MIINNLFLDLKKHKCLIYMYVFKLLLVFFIGKFTINSTLKIVECPQCHLFACLDSSIYNSSQDQIMILWEKWGLWIAVQAPRVWEGSPTVHIVLQLLHKIFHRGKRFIGLLIAAIMSIIAITTVAAVCGGR